MQRRGWRIELCYQNRFWKLPLWLVIYRDRRRNECDRVIVTLGAIKNLRVKDGDPNKNRDNNDLGAIAQEKVSPRHPPGRERGKQV